MPAQDLNELPPSIRRLIDRIEEEAPLTPAKTKSLLEESAITADDLEPWADYDHPDTDSYGRKMIWDGGHFELMAMSWRPGDYSAIHDHGHTQWGAVKLFGNVEHAIFSLKNGQLETMDRSTYPTGSVMAVAHDLVHQMGNVGQPPYLTLHLYGCDDREGGITADARIFELDEEKIQFTSGGVFFSLPEKAIERRESGPEADLPTRLRHHVEKLRRLERTGVSNGGREAAERLREKIWAPGLWTEIGEHVEGLVDDEGHAQPSPALRIFFRELRAAAELETSLEGGTGDPARVEAELWDEAIAPRHLESYVAEYLRFVRERFRLDLPAAAVLSVGCRTGRVEDFLLRELGLPADHLLGLEPSEAMLRIAAQRIRAEAADPLSLARSGERSSLVLAGIHTLQRQTPTPLDQTVGAIAGLTRPGGLFVGDFVWGAERPDPGVWRGERSLLLEQDLSEVFAPGRQWVNEYLEVRLGDERLSYRSSRERVDPQASLDSLYPLFRQHFGGGVHLYDALTLEELDPGEAKSGSRCLLVAEKGS